MVFADRVLAVPARRACGPARGLLPAPPQGSNGAVPVPLGPRPPRSERPGRPRAERPAVEVLTGSVPPPLLRATLVATPV
jgi:hypothetical protein